MQICMAGPIGRRQATGKLQTKARDILCIDAATMVPSRKCCICGRTGKHTCFK